MPEEPADASADVADEASLVARARENDSQAWAEIYDRYHRPVYRYVRARVFDEAAAEDLASAVFLAALQGIDRYRERGRPLLAWLYAITRHTVADHHRRTLGRGGLLGRLPGLGGRKDPERPPEELAGGDDPAEAVGRLDLRQAISRLPDAQRDVVILRHFVGLSTPEIAGAMGKKPAAIYSLEARALENLRAALGSPGEVPKEISGATDENRALEAINE